jgi:hypothetical protein
MRATRVDPDLWQVPLQLIDDIALTSSSLTLVCLCLCLCLCVSWDPTVTTETLQKILLTRGGKIVFF